MALGKCLMVNTGLEALELRGNHFTEAGVHALLEGLESNLCVTGYVVCDALLLKADVGFCWRWMM